VSGLWMKRVELEETGTGSGSISISSTNFQDEKIKATIHGRIVALFVLRCRWRTFALTLRLLHMKELT
jgi:hypothetical protein